MCRISIRHNPLDGDARVEVASRGTVLSSAPLHVAAGGPHDVVAWTFALPVAGAFDVRVMGADGAVLATGTVSAP